MMTKEKEIASQRAQRLSDMFPPHIASAQAAWEMRQSIRRTRDAGLSTTEIAKLLKTNRARVHQMLQKREQKLPPIESYFRERLDLISLVSRSNGNGHTPRVIRIDRRHQHPKDTTLCHNHNKQQKLAMYFVNGVPFCAACAGKELIIMSVQK
jgi:DNA-binding transcriptional MerR regulator